jgi:hypothetical protein
MYFPDGRILYKLSWENKSSLSDKKKKDKKEALKKITRQNMKKGD